MNLAAPIACLASAMAPPPAIDLKGLNIGGEVGVYRPSSAFLRNALGENWISFGLKRVSAEQKSGIKLTTDLAITSRSSRGNRALLIRPSVGAAHVGGNAGDMVQTFAAARLGLVYADYRFGTLSSSRIGVGTNVEAGLIFGGRVIVSARYDWMPTFDGIRFDGLTLSVAVQLFRF